MFAKTAGGGGVLWGSVPCFSEVSEVSVLLWLKCSLHASGFGRGGGGSGGWGVWGGALTGCSSGVSWISWYPCGSSHIRT